MSLTEHFQRGAASEDLTGKRFRDIVWFDPDRSLVRETVMLNGQEWIIAVAGFQSGLPSEIPPIVRRHPEPDLSELIFPLSGHAWITVSQDGQFNFGSMEVQEAFGQFSALQIPELNFFIEATRGPDIVPGRAEDNLRLLVIPSDDVYKPFRIRPLVTPRGFFHQTVIDKPTPLQYFVVKMEPRVEVVEGAIDHATVQAEVGKVTARTKTGRTAQFYGSISSSEIRQPRPWSIPNGIKVIIDENAVFFQDKGLMTLEAQRREIEGRGLTVACSNFTQAGVWAIAY